MKPCPSMAMLRLIADIRAAVPFDIPESSLCLGPCAGCSKKLIEFLDDQLCDWQSKLDAGYEPRLGDINKLAKTAKKIHKVLVKNNFISLG
ncbi:MAG: hypothetical protein OQK04_00555 [Kangiellaceae bacterium]|nr:hypothetical protein [Kangiellaceae bacterium]MCW8997190.1 hypothetical protein [Kangiellaceae bacterium]